MNLKTAVGTTERGIATLSGSFHQVTALHGAKLGADEDSGTLLDSPFQITRFGTDRSLAGPGHKRCEGDAVRLVRLLHAGGLEVLQDHLGEGLLGSVSGTAVVQGVDQLVVLIHAEYAVGAEALDGEGTGDADFLVVRVGLVVEVLELGFGGDGFVDFLLAGDAGGPPLGEEGWD